MIHISKCIGSIFILYIQRLRVKFKYVNSYIQIDSKRNNAITISYMFYTIDFIPHEL